MTDKTSLQLACEVNRAIHQKDADRILRTVRHLMEHHGLAARADAIDRLPRQMVNTLPEQTSKTLAVGGTSTVS